MANFIIQTKPRLPNLAISADTPLSTKSQQDLWEEVQALRTTLNEVVSFNRELLQAITAYVDEETSEYLDDLNATSYE